LNCANALGTNSTIPILNMSDIDDSDKSHQSCIYACRNPKSNSASGDWDLETLTSKFSENLTTLKYLARVNENDNGCSSGGKAHHIKDSDKLYFTERSLQQLSNLWGPRKFATSGCIAAIIFLDNSLRGIQLNSRLMDRLVARLHHSMQLVFEEMSQYSGKEKANNAIFWVLFVGGVASGVRRERDWFLAQLIDFKELLGVQSWEDAETILKEFLWPNIWYRLGSLLWNEVEDTQKMKVPAESRTSHRGLGAHIYG